MDFSFLLLFIIIIIALVVLIMYIADIRDDLEKPPEEAKTVQPYWIYRPFYRFGRPFRRRRRRFI